MCVCVCNNYARISETNDRFIFNSVCTLYAIIIIYESIIAIITQNNCTHQEQNIHQREHNFDASHSNILRTGWHFDSLDFINIMFNGIAKSHYSTQ